MNNPAVFAVLISVAYLVFCYVMGAKEVPVWPWFPLSAATYVLLVIGVLRR